jgi:hypothetical protein
MFLIGCFKTSYLFRSIYYYSSSYNMMMQCSEHCMMSEVTFDFYYIANAYSLIISSTCNANHIIFIFYNYL